MALGKRAGRRIFLATAFAGIALANTAAHRTSKIHSAAFSQDRRIISVKLKDFRRELRELKENGFELAGVDIPNSVAEFYVNSEGASALRALKGEGAIILDKEVSKAAPDAAYQTSAKIETALRKYATDYPRLTMLKSAGKSVENRDIFAIKISTNAASHDPRKAVVFFNAMHHAREVMTSEVALDTIDYLLTNYGRDAKVTHWLETMEIWVMPMLNVDGNNKVWTGNNMWRKNVRGGYGVDINRNYPYAWNSCDGSSGSTFADDYHGPSAGSEPETQALMALVREINPVLSISYHSYSELVIYPYGCDGARVPNRDVVETLGSELARRIPSDNGSGSYTAGTAWELLYAVDGGDIDWMFNEAEVLPFVIELNSTRLGFQPSYSQYRDQTVRKVRAGWSWMLDRAEGPGIRAIVTDRRGNLINGATMTFERVDKDAGARSLRVKSDGSVHAVLLPGSYRVSFAAPGHDPVDQVVEINDRRVDLEVGI